MGLASRKILESKFESLVLGSMVLTPLLRYTYSVCFFGEAVQKANSNGATTSLG